MLDLHRNVLRLVPGIGTDRIRALMEWKQGLHLGQFLNGPYTIKAGQGYQQAALRARQQLEDHANDFDRTAAALQASASDLRARLAGLVSEWSSKNLIRS